MRETWYILDDGTSVDPNEVAPDNAGVLMHKSGIAVAVGPHGPRSRGVDPDEERAKKAKPADDKPPVAGKNDTKDMKPKDDPKAAYTTRESKAG